MIDWNTHSVRIVYAHTNCGGELKVLAKLGVDTQRIVSVYAMRCEKCGMLVTNVDEKEIERKLESYER